ncbi:MAG: hypothetical protein QG675_217 [Patescibacteria group bacterium]|jgi:hypothetical protein|nr:hypothetical protein [Patescibacteria group bacterium]
MDTIFNIISTAFSIIGTILFQFWGWTLIATVLVYLIWKNNRKAEITGSKSSEYSLIHIIVPKDNDKKELSAEQMFASLHGILRPTGELQQESKLQDHISFEIVSIDQIIHFYVWVPTELKDFVESQIYAQYPTVQINSVEEDYTKQDFTDKKIYETEITLTKDEIFPIRTFLTFEVDPLAGLTTVLASMSEGEQMWIQFLMEPVDDSWHTKSLKYIDEVVNGKKEGVFDNLGKKALKAPLFAARALSVPPSVEAANAKPGSKPELSPGQTTINTAIETKAQKLGFAMKIRAIYVGDNDMIAKQRIQALVGGFKQFNTINLNGFTNTSIATGEKALEEYRERKFEDAGYVLNIEEMASLYHLPHTSVETPGVAYTSTKVGQPPSNLPMASNTPPESLSLFGTTTFRQGNAKFGIKREDRMRHLYIIGKSGVGKSFLLNLLTLSDVFHNKGFAVVDPHGDYAQDIMRFIPEHRIDDVVYFNPADGDFPVAFNPMEVMDVNRRNNVASEIVGVLKKMFGDSWGPRLEHILRYTLLALLETPNTTLLGIVRMLTDKKYRNEIIANVKDPVVKAFWINEFASWNEKFASEAVAPVLNKVGAFTANPLIRNVLGQEKSSFNIRKIMDEGKILIVDLSRGKIGEDNASILGSLIITKIQLDAMSRADIPNIEDRIPFYLYVDEFQNFATESFAVILSEARKYGLYLTVANQYIAQMPEEVRDAVFGNVGSMISFRVGADDANYLSKYFEPVFEPLDLVNLDKQNIYVSMSIDGQTSLPFSAKTLLMPQPPNDQTPRIIQQSREKYASSKSEVETQIEKWSGMSNDGNDKQGQGSTQSTSSTNTEQPKNNVNNNNSHPSLKVSGAEPKKYSEYIKKNSNSNSNSSGSNSRNRNRNKNNRNDRNSNNKA